jgi:predicted GNAT superfamily acetyltransferase
MTDLVNAGDASDRLMVKWRVTNGAPQSLNDLLEIPKGAIRIAIPEDIVALRAKSVEEAMAERLRVRTEFLTALDSGFKVIGFSNAHGYILSNVESGK